MQTSTSQAAPALDALARADAHLIHPLTQQGAHRTAGPLVYASGDGAEVVLADGRRMIDATSGLWCVNVGHGRERLAEAARAQMATLAFAPTFTSAGSVPAIELAERVAELTPPGIVATMFTSGGSEATETAFKLARLYWRVRGEEGKTIVLSHDRAYHGLSIGATAATGLTPYHGDFGPLARDFERIPTPYGYRCEHAGASVPCDSGTCPVARGAALERRIDELGADRVAAVIVEPVVGTGGVIPPPPGYLEAVREICTRKGVLMIADEVITGFGRTGRWFGVAHAGVVPDLMTFAKGITSGYVPLGATSVSQDVWDALREIPGDRPLMHGFTYSGHPVSCAVALENLRILEEERLVERVAAASETLAGLLEPLRALPHVGDVRQRGFMAGVELVADKATKERFPAARGVGGAVTRAARERGVLTRGLIDDVMVIAPPFVTSERQLAQIVDALAESIEAATEAA